MEGYALSNDNDDDYNDAADDDVQAIKGRRKIRNRKHNLTYSRVRPSNT